MPSHIPDSLVKRQKELVALFKTRNDELTRLLGVSLEFDSEGVCTMGVPGGELIGNPIGGVSGAVLAYLVDYAGWFAAAQFYSGWVSTTNIRVDYLQPSAPKDLSAVARVISTGKRMALCRIEICDSEGELISVGTAGYTASSVSYQSN